MANAMDNIRNILAGLNINDPVVNGNRSPQFFADAASNYPYEEAPSAYIDKGQRPWGDLAGSNNVDGYDDLMAFVHWIHAKNPDAQSIKAEADKLAYKYSKAKGKGKGMEAKITGPSGHSADVWRERDTEGTTHAMAEV